MSSFLFAPSSTSSSSYASTSNPTTQSLPSPLSIPPSVPPFPHAGLLPKLETQSHTFLSSNPTSDGRGVLVAIFDTGTDIAAPGLRTTTDGKPKITAAFDCSGSGDVDVSEERTAEEGEGGDETGGGWLTTLSGRRVQVGSLGAVGGRYRVGVKRAYELFPDVLVSRLKKGRRKRWDDSQRQLETALHRAVQEAEEGSRERADLELRYNEVKAMARGYEDAGPVFDVLAYQAGGGEGVGRGEEWTAVVVSEDEEGRPVLGKPLRPYHLHHEWDTFSGEDLHNYSVTIDPPSHTVTLVVQAGAHGTHVAGIVAAHFPEQPELNGQAPGAQLVSVKIGDSRLGSMETGVGLMRGVMVALQQRCDVINMSYGEASAQCDVGRFPDAVRDLVNRYGILFVCSAGNSGPALTSAGSPGATTSDVIGVGAYVSPAMMLADYSLRKSLQATQYTWSSRGPSADGALGVCISAPGGAITSVPTWTLQGLQLMHGTSMSSPSATSALALLLSACKQDGLRYSPHRIRKAIENTAAPIPGLDPLTTGCGLLQIHDAYTHITAHQQHDDLDIAFRVTVGGTHRGVYLREMEEVNKAQDVTITIEPAFYEPEPDAVTPHAAAHKALSPPSSSPPPHTSAAKEHPTPASSDSNSASSAAATTSSTSSTPSSSAAYALNQSKVSFQLKVALINPSPSYIDCPAHLMLMHGGRSFSITVHPHRLPPGLHHSQILGVDSTSPARGPLFRIPITITVPERPQLADSSAAAEPHSLPPLALSSPHVLENVQDGEEVNVGIIPSFPTPLVSFAAAPQPFPSSSSPSPSSPSPSPSPPPGVEYRFPSLPFHPGTIHRRFLSIPDASTYAEFRLRGHSIDTSRHFMFHAVFLLPDTPFRDHELNKYFALQAEEEVRWTMDVVGGRTLEVCLAQYWNVDGECAVDVDVSFHSIQCDGGAAVTLDGSRGLHRLDVVAGLRTEALQPVVSLKGVQQGVRPSSSHLGALTALDVLPGSRQVYELVLGYTFEVKEDSCKVTCVFPLLQGVLYESCYESQLFMLFDHAKRLLGSGDAWPKDLTVKRGKYTTRIQVRHDEVAMLERLKDMLMTLDLALPKPMELPVYPTRNAALQAGTKFGDRRVIKVGQRRAMWLVGPDMKALPAWVKGGDVLVGSLALAKGNGGGSKAGSVALKVTVPPLVPPEKKEGKKEGGVGGAKVKEGVVGKVEADEKVKVEEKAVDEVKDAQARPGAPRDEADVKKRLEEVRPVVTEVEKEAKAHATGSIEVSIEGFEKKGEGGGNGEGGGGGGKGGGGRGEGEEGKEGGEAVAKAIAEEVRDLQIDYIAGLKGAKKQAAFSQIGASLLTQHPQHLPLLLLKAETAYDAFTTARASSSSKSAAASPSSSSSISSLQPVLDACDAVVAALDTKDIAAEYGRLVDKDSPEHTKRRKAYDKQKDALVAAHTLRLQAMKAAGVGADGPVTVADFDRAYGELASWVDPAGKEQRVKLFAVTAKWHRVKGRLGAGLKQLNASIAETGAGEVTVEVYEERLATLRAMVQDEALVQHWQRSERAWNVIRFPKHYTRF